MRTIKLYATRRKLNKVTNTKSFKKYRKHWAVLNKGKPVSTIAAIKLGGITTGTRLVLVKRMTPKMRSHNKRSFKTLEKRYSY